MAKPKGSKVVRCACGKRYFLLPGVAKVCKCGATVGAVSK